MECQGTLPDLASGELASTERVASTEAAPTSSPSAGFYARKGSRLLSLGVIALGAPLALAVGALVALGNLLAFGDPRKILFFQERVGQHGKIFRLIKFRTMSEARNNFAAWSEGDQLRVTRFGRLLRNAHLDELPQLLNVILGDMNLVGPRPEMLEVEEWAEEAVPGFGKRLSVPPGLTGLAQITQGYTSCDAAAYGQKLSICQDYLQRRSLALDLKIMAMTAVWMLRGRGWSWNQQAEVATPQG